MHESIDLAPLRFAILGCGAVGRAFALELAPAGLRVVLWSRHDERARALLAQVKEDPAARGPVSVAASLAAALDGTDVVLLCLSDTALAEGAARLAALRPIGAGEEPAPVVLHHAGYHGPELLDPLARVGWSVGKLHPLAAMPPGVAVHGALRGAWFAVGGAPRARAVGSALVTLLGGEELVLAAGEGVSRAYHGAAALVAGGAVALVDLAEGVFRQCLEDGTRARPALLSLLQSATRPLHDVAPPEALAGPFVRGDLGVVEGHLAALASHDEAAARAYVELGKRMAVLAEARGSIDAVTRQALERLLHGE